MSENSIWIRIKRWTVAKKGPSDSSARTDHLCSAGKHPIDPNWNECPLCKHEALTEQKAKSDKPFSAPQHDESRSPTMTRNPTSTGNNEPKPVRGSTKVDPQTEASSAFEPSRKIVGILITFSWRSEGQLFAIYEGKNFIGRGTVESEGGRACEIQINNDKTLSNEHALILCRAGRYELFDQKSTSGTFLNDEFVDNRGTKLSERGRIKTGATVWIFQRIESDATEGDTPDPSHEDTPEEPVKGRKESHVG